MKITHVVPTYFPAIRYGGPILSVHYLCRALASRGHEVSVATTSVDGPGDLDVPTDRPVNVDGVSVSYFPSKYLRRLYWSPNLTQYLHKHLKNTDFLHLHSVFLWPTSAAARLAAVQQLPWCVSPRGALVPELVQKRNRIIKKTWLALVEKYTLEGAAFIHATSELEGENINEFGFHLPKVQIVPNGVDIPEAINIEETLANFPNIPRSSQILLFLGRVSWKKGLDRLIPALTQVPTAQLVIAGNDEENLTPSLKHLAQKSGVASRVIFIGPIYGKYKDALLSMSTLLVLPSYNENFGNVVLESFACGRPVAVTAAVGLAPIVLAANAGVIIPDDIMTMGLVLADLLKSPNRLDEMGRNGHALVSTSYSWDAIAQKMESAYAEARESNSSERYR